MESSLRCGASEKGPNSPVGIGGRQGDLDPGLQLRDASGDLDQVLSLPQEPTVDALVGANAVRRRGLVMMKRPSAPGG